MGLCSITNTCGTRVVRFRGLDDGSVRADDWDRLAGGVPFRSWAWTSHWWRHYGAGQDRHGGHRSLFSLGVVDPAGSLIGIAPWYVESSLAEGRVVRFLGSGEVCSDYLSVLCAPGSEEAVGAALADWLTAVHAPQTARPADGGHDDGGGRDRWDLLELTGVDAEDAAVGRLVQQLEGRGNTVHRRSGPSFWRIELPGRWDEYLARLSKDHRKRVRRLERDVVSSDRLAVHRVERLDHLDHAWQVLVDLHQRRRRSLGEPGCFASSRFATFHGHVTADLLRGGQLHLRWIALDGRPVAAEYALAGDGVIYAYQSGVDPDALDHSPGRLSHIVMLREAIEQGYRAVDFLRGDEPYKPHWRAQPRPGVEIRVVPDQAGAQLRHGLWRVGTGMKEWVKGGLRMARG